MDSFGSVSFGGATPNSGLAPFNGADNGLSVDPVTGKVVLGNDDPGVLATLLGPRLIPTSFFSVRFTNSNNSFAQIGNGGFSANADVAEGGGDFNGLSVFQNNDAVAATAQVQMVAGSAQGLSLGSLNLSDPNFPGSSFLQHGNIGGASPAIPVFLTIGCRQSGGSIRFTTQDSEKMRLIESGQLLIGALSAFSNAYTLQVGDGGSDKRSLFNTNTPYAVAVRNGVGVSDLFYIGATASATPDGLFSNQAGSEVFRILNGGGVSAPAAGYGFGGSGAAAQGMFASGGVLALVALAGNNINFGTGASANKFGNFQDADNSLNLKGPIATNGLGTKWGFGALTVAAAVLDGTQYLNVTVGGVARKLALIV